MRKEDVTDREMIMEFLPWKLEQDLVLYAGEAALLGVEWAKKHGAMESVKDRVEDMMAKWKSEVLIPTGMRDTSAYREGQVRITNRWIDFKADVVIRKNEALVLKVKYDIAKRNFDCARSLLSSKNTERRTGI